MMKIARSLLALTAAIMLGLAVACGGNEAAPGERGENVIGLNTGNLLSFSQTSQKLADLRSFRFDFVMRFSLPDLDASGSATDPLSAELARTLMDLLADIRAEGAYVAPDRFQADVRFAGEDLRYVQIENRAWEKEGSGPWRETRPDPLLSPASVPTDFFADVLPGDLLRIAGSSRETVNGLNATRYSFDEGDLARAAQGLGGTIDLTRISEASFDIWLTDDEIPVKVLFVVRGKDADDQDIAMSLEMNVHDINSDAIVIRPPI